MEFYKLIWQYRFQKNKFLIEKETSVASLCQYKPLVQADTRPKQQQTIRDE